MIKKVEKLTEEQKVIIRDAVNKGVKLIDTCKLANCNYGQACYVSSKENLPVDIFVLDFLTEIRMVEDYKSGIGPKKLALRYNVTDHVVTSVLRRHKVFRNMEKRRTIPNEYLFHSETEQSMWFMGWIFSDGNVRKVDNGINITTHIKDIELYEKFKIFTPISLIKSKETTLIYTAHSKIWKDKLLSYGCMPAKSKIIDYPNIKLHGPFLRGLFEGDGHITFLYGNPRKCKIGISSGSEKMIKSLSRVFDELQIHYTILFKSGGNRFGECYSFEVIRLLDVLKFLDFIYGDADLNCTLSRKYNRYLQFKETFSKNIINSHPKKSF